MLTFIIIYCEFCTWHRLAHLRFNALSSHALCCIGHRYYGNYQKNKHPAKLSLKCFWNVIPWNGRLQLDSMTFIINSMSNQMALVTSIERKHINRNSNRNGQLRMNSAFCVRVLCHNILREYVGFVRRGHVFPVYQFQWNRWNGSIMDEDPFVCEHATNLRPAVSYHAFISTKPIWWIRNGHGKWQKVSNV